MYTDSEPDFQETDPDLFPEEQQRTGNPFELIPRSARGGLPKLKAIMRKRPELYNRILLMIESGAYAHQAAAAFGIDQRTFNTWMRRGETAQGGVFHQFWLDVTTAQARSRVMAETDVKRLDPKFWLTHGPGKERPNQPGWGKSEEVSINQTTHLTSTATKETVDNANLAETLRQFHELGLIQFTGSDEEEGEVIRIDELPPPEDPPEPIRGRLPLSDPSDPT